MAKLNNETNQIIIYQTEDGKTKLDVRLEDETVWLSQQQIAELYQSSRTNVVEHIKHVYEDGELDENSTCRNFRQVQIEGSKGYLENIKSIQKKIGNKEEKQE